VSLYSRKITNFCSLYKKSLRLTSLSIVVEFYLHLLTMKTKKKAGRRLKRDWRRKIDVTDVDTYMNSKRTEERLG